MLLDKLKGYGWMAAALVLGGLLVAQTVRLHAAQLDAANTRTKNAQTLQHIADLTAKALRAVRAQEARWAADQERNARETATQIAAANADAASARRASDGLRQRIAALVADARRATANPSPAPAIEAAGDPIGVLADVLGRADQRAGILAAYADAARISGQSCERDYDALTEPPRPAAGILPGSAEPESEP
jgi:hypothetical protein